MLQQGLKMIKCFSAWHGMKATITFEYDAVLDDIFKLAVENLFDSNFFSVSHYGFRILDNVSVREVWLWWQRLNERGFLLSASMNI